MSKKENNTCFTEKREFQGHEYTIYTNSKDVVVAVSTYNHHPVRAEAKCDPRDAFNYALGVDIAIARCASKIAARKLKRARVKYIEAERLLKEAADYHGQMYKYYASSIREKAEVETFLSHVCEKADE